MQSSVTRLFSSAMASLATEPSGPGVPARRVWAARRLVIE